MLEQATDELTGRSVGEFVLRDRIGAGGFGAVYRAVQQGLDREAVVKVLHGEYRSNDEVVKRFLREASLAARLDHPYVAHIYAFGLEPDGLLWIAMEHVRGRALDRFLAEEGPLPLADLVPFFERLCEVVQAAHDRGIVHRDIKPANVMVLSRVRRLLPKLLDLGIAKLVGAEPAPRAPAAATSWRARAESLASTDLDETALGPTSGASSDSPVLTRAGDIIGSPPYMAPEQWMSPEAADARTDVYALGVLVYEALVGRRPFEARTAIAMADAHQHQPVPPVGEGFPPAVDQVIATAMEKRPEDRYATPLELAAALRAAAGVAPERSVLPRLPESLRDLWVTSGPQPLATSIAVLDAARSAHQARDALWNAARVAIRYLALLALACRARERAGEPDSARVIELLRQLRQHALDDHEWLELARELVRPFGDRPDAHPIPELVALLHPDEPCGRLLERKMPTEGGARGEDQVRAHLAEGLVALERFLRQAAFLFEYPVGVPHQGQPESWMGVPRPRRPVMECQAELPEGQVIVVDREGRLVVSLHPLVQVARPAPGHDPEMFLLDGKSPFGARMVSLPVGYERRDERIWAWFGESVPGARVEQGAVAEEDSPPYRGLAAFTSDDAGRFFGRERRIESVVNRLRVEPLLAVVGPSGAGKTSFVQAGVVPSLPPGWSALGVRPGRAPLAALEVCLRAAGVELTADLRADPDALGAALRAAGASRGTVVVAVEQFEEVFTLCSDPEEQRLYLEGLSRAARNSEDPVRVVLTLRDDFLVRAQSAPALRDRLSQAIEILSTPDQGELLRILVEPARRAGYEFETPELPSEMVSAVADKPGGLALLSFTAAALWEVRDREGKRLTRRGYEALGGVAGALAQHAEATLATLPREQQRLVREVFRHLITAEGTRAILSRDDLLQLLGGSEHSGAVVERLVGARLLVTHEGEFGEDRVEIAHEALVTAWPRLGVWVREDSEGARMRDQLRAAARVWDERGRTRGLLLRDEALADYKRWRANHPGALTALESEFAETSLRDEARGRRIRRTLVATIVTVLSAALVLLLWLNDRAKDQRARAEEHLLGLYEEQGRQALLARDYPRSAAFLSAARSGGRDGPALRFMLAEALRPLRERPLVLRHGEAPTWVTFSPDGTRLLTSSKVAPDATIWSTAGGARLHSLGGHLDGIWMATFDPDGALIATAGRDGNARLWSAVDGSLVATLRHGDSVRWVAFSPTGDRLATASQDGSARIFSRAGEELATLRGHDAPVAHVSWSGGLLATAGADGSARIWDAATFALLRTIAAPSGEPVFAELTPDGRTLAIASADGAVAVVDLGGDGQARALAGHLGPITDLSFSPDGRAFLTASADGAAKLWDVESGRLLASLEGHRDEVMSAVFSPDGTRCLTSSFDGTARLWDRSGTPLAVLVGHSALVYRAVFDGSGDRVATASIDGSARIWSGKVRSTVRFLVGHRAPVRSAVFSHDGARLLTVSADGTARVWDPASGELVNEIGIDAKTSLGLFLPGGALGLVEGARVRIHGGVPGAVLEADSSIWWAEVAPDGARLLTISQDRSVIVWDLGTLQRGPSFAASAARFSRDGRTIVTVAVGGEVEVRDAATGRLTMTAGGHHGRAWYALPCAGGQRVLSMGGDGSLRAWDAATGAQISAAPLKLNYVGFEVTDDCRFIAAMGDRRLATVLDASDGEPLNYIESRSGATYLTIDPAGSRIAVVEGDRIVLWNLELENESPEVIESWTRCAIPFRVDGAEFRAVGTDPGDCVSP